MMRREVICGMALLALDALGCASKAPVVAHSKPATHAEIVTDQDPSPPQRSPHATTQATTPCAPIGAFRLQARNETQANGDLCARFQAAVLQTAALRSIQPPNAFELFLTLRKMDLAPPHTCNIAIEVRAGGSYIALAAGGAVVRGGLPPNRLAAGDCIDTVIEQLLTTKIAPTISQTVAAGGATGSGAVGSVITQPPRP
jgi:hypothetical protein